ncbi:MAG: hypothetical protein FJX75_07625 [Armatimonadetes bacterium]|nr:hypothetical protein [Armatimonadota bacterium]
MRVLSAVRLAAATGSYGDREACQHDAIGCETVVCGLGGCDNKECDWDVGEQICKNQRCTGAQFDTCVSCGPFCETKCEEDSGGTPCVVTLKGTWNPELEKCVQCTELWVPPFCIQKHCKTSPMPTEPPGGP